MNTKLTSGMKLVLLLYKFHIVFDAVVLSLFWILGFFFNKLVYSIFCTIVYTPFIFYFHLNRKSVNQISVQCSNCGWKGKFKHLVHGFKCPSCKSDNVEECLDKEVNICRN